MNLAILLLVLSPVLVWILVRVGTRAYLWTLDERKKRGTK